MIILSTMHSPTCLPSTWQSAPTASPHPSLLYQTLCCTPKNSSSTCLDLSVLMLRRPTSLFHRRLLCQDLPNSNVITSQAQTNLVAKKKKLWIDLTLHHLLAFYMHGKTYDVIDGLGTWLPHNKKKKIAGLPHTKNTKNRTSYSMFLKWATTCKIYRVARPLKQDSIFDSLVG